MSPFAKTIVRRGALALLILALAGCGQDLSEVEQFVHNEDQKPGPPLPPVPVLQQFETFIYNDQGLRDPFAVPVDKNASNKGPRPDETRPKQPLEAFPLDSLNMVGTLNTNSQTAIVGLVMAPDRVLHRVTAGSYLGQNEGKVTAVHEDRIDITELVPDGAGGWIERQASLALATKQ
jgi:type IV pilus assembly protein PilP